MAIFSIKRLYARCHSSIHRFMSGKKVGVVAEASSCSSGGRKNFQRGLVQLSTSMGGESRLHQNQVSERQGWAFAKEGFRDLMSVSVLFVVHNCHCLAMSKVQKVGNFCRRCDQSFLFIDNLTELSKEISSSRRGWEISEDYIGSTRS